jgi:acyl-coenzyme A synthetase/AMP-(fatty) acid ligase
MEDMLVQTVPASTRTIPDAIAHHAHLRPDAPALVSERRTMTWQELNDATSSLARTLRDLGVTPRDCIAFHCTTPMTLDDLVTAFGIMSACAIVRVDSTHPLPERRRIIERLAPLAIVSPADRDPSGLPLPCWTVSDGARLSGADPVPGRAPAQNERPAPGDAAVILTSSGTTAESKLIPVRQERLMVLAASVSERFDIGPADRMLHMYPPPFGMFAFTAVPLHSGGVTIISEQAEESAQLGLASWQAPTWTAGSPSRLAILADHMAATVPGSATSFRFVLSVGAAATDANIASIARGLRTQRVDFYASTESFFMAVDRTITARLRIGNDRGAGLPPGEIGEIQVRGPLVFSGYLDDPELTAAAFTADGWFCTGDAGRIESDGRLTVLGRLVEQINRGGLKIAPLEIENAIVAHPDVLEAAAFAIPHPTLGQDAGLAIVARPGAALTNREIRRWLLDRLPAAKVPRSIHTLEALPLTATGKVQRRALAALVMATHPGNADAG